MPFGNAKLNDGNELPEIAFGTGTALRGSDASKYVEQALSVGFTHIDTAQMYQNEASVGEGIQDSGLARSDLFVTTKYGGGEPISKAIYTSLSKLGLSHVDLYLVHTPVYMLPNFKEAWAQMEQIKEDGLAKSIGVSNFGILELKTLLTTAKITPAVNQIKFHPYNWAVNKPLLEYSAKYNITTEAYSSLSPITKYPGGPVDKPIQAAADRLNATSAQVIFSWVLSKNVTIVTTSSKKEHLEEYLSVADLPPLTEKEIAAIDAAGLRGPSAKCGSIRDRAYGLVSVQNVLFVCLLGFLVMYGAKTWRARRTSHFQL